MPANLGHDLLQLCHHVLKIHTDEYKMILTKGSLLWIFSMGQNSSDFDHVPAQSKIRANRCDRVHLRGVGYGAWSTSTWQSGPSPSHTEGAFLYKVLRINISICYRKLFKISKTLVIKLQNPGMSVCIWIRCSWPARSGFVLFSLDPDSRKKCLILIPGKIAN